MQFPRSEFLRLLLDARGNGMVKIVTGVRRCGKSCLLALFHGELKRRGVRADHAIAVALRDATNAGLRDPLRPLTHIKDRVVDADTHYALLDDIMLVDRGVEVLNSLLRIRNLDVYVTADDGRFLTRNVPTEFRGRGEEIRLWPLSFSEYWQALGGAKADRWQEYRIYGGLPGVALLADGQEKVEALEGLCAEACREISARRRFRKSGSLEALLRVAALNAGEVVTARRLSLASGKDAGIGKTVAGRLSCLEDAFVLERVARCDARTRWRSEAQSKLYFSDIGMRNALLGFQRLGSGGIEETVVHNELRRRGFCVQAGCVRLASRQADGVTRCGSLAVDFVTEFGSRRFYVQMEREGLDARLALRKIGDSALKVLVSRNNIHRHQDEEGFLHVGLWDFLLDEESIWRL